jgi:hypothetical protein
MLLRKYWAAKRFTQRVLWKYAAIKSSSKLYGDTRQVICVESTALKACVKYEAMSKPISSQDEQIQIYLLRISQLWRIIETMEGITGMQGD